MLGMVFYAGLSFGTYETLRDSSLKRESDYFLGVRYKRHTEKGSVTEWYVNSCCGMIAGLTSQFVCFPIDTAKRRMQNAHLIKSQAALKNPVSIIATWKDLWRRGGYRMIYK